LDNLKGAPAKPKHAAVNLLEDAHEPRPTDARRKPEVSSHDCRCDSSKYEQSCDDRNFAKFKVSAVAALTRCRGVHEALATGTAQGTKGAIHAKKIAGITSGNVFGRPARG